MLTTGQSGPEFRELHVLFYCLGQIEFDGEQVNFEEKNVRDRSTCPWTTIPLSLWSIQSFTPFTWRKILFSLENPIVSGNFHFYWKIPLSVESSIVSGRFIVSGKLLLVENAIVSGKQGGNSICCGSFNLAASNAK